MGIKVRAINPGHYGKFREQGHEFEVENESHLSKRWMERLDGKPIKSKDFSDDPLAAKTSKVEKTEKVEEKSKSSVTAKEVI